MQQTHKLCVYWEPLQYNPITGKYFIIRDEPEYYDV